MSANPNTPSITPEPEDFASLRTFWEQRADGFCMHLPEGVIIHFCDTKKATHAANSTDTGPITVLAPTIMIYLQGPDASINGDRHALRDAIVAAGAELRPYLEYYGCVLYSGPGELLMTVWPDISFLAEDKQGQKDGNGNNEVTEEYEGSEESYIPWSEVVLHVELIEKSDKEPSIFTCPRPTEVRVPVIRIHQHNPLGNDLWRSLIAAGEVLGSWREYFCCEVYYRGKLVASAWPSVAFHEDLTVEKEVMKVFNVPGVEELGRRPRDFDEWHKLHEFLEE
ncbi:uncharacterized protein F4822DRAFT_442968 [Hypoxylon trugodes]|uniref:uncharacterized protein n=1 Tax=Hypoxylon trugodes TaxID=326681 RepID=UPI00219D041B|nr:uncharacterized protein F4822DRAFT_442968 [Hypoxylon trugodes]KAI1389920.1 hypothetical protein F4822DRAFT_442968 [Hypoxylon trugodes]